jgi:hypothetical protein
MPVPGRSGSGTLSIMRSIPLALVVALASTAGPASGETIPYSPVGVQNPDHYEFTAAATGDVIAYFDGNGGADYEDSLGLLVNGVPSGVVGLGNHQSSFGEELDLGQVEAGATLTFVLYVATTGNVWYSNAALDSDGAQHVYSAPFAGNASLPSGTYVGFEDLAAPVADFNYADEQFVVTDVAARTVPTPLPGSLPLFVAGCFAVALVRRGRGRR